MGMKHLTTSASITLLVSALCVSGAFASPMADRVLVIKSQKRLLLLRAGSVLKSYRIALGRKPGAKTCQGDCRTPEGRYVIDRHNSRSRFYKSLHISYPNAVDLSQARKTGHSAGGEVMIHGLPRGFEDLGTLQATRNWTKGCIAVSNREMDEIWQLVADGTPIDIRP